MRTELPGVSAELRAGIAELAAEVSLALDRDRGPIPARLDHAGARRLLGALWDETVDRTIAALSGETSGAQARLAGLLTRIRSLEIEVENARTEHDRGELLAGLHDALARLRAARTVEDLFGTALELGHDCLGFDRTLLSRVEDGRWKLHSMAVPRAPGWAEDILAAGTAHPPPLDGGIVESDVVAKARPGLVFDVPDNPRVFRPLATAGKSESYGMAPVVLHGEVVALVHADRYYQRRTVTRDDRAVLAVFAQGFAQSLAHVTVLDGLAALHTGTAIPVPVRRPALDVSAPGTGDTALTRREVDVMRLVASGATNNTISRRLVISEATVKSHVTSILRKLGATNRADAVAQWLRAGPVRRSQECPPGG
ncbi:LuxR C-terminal-related transcriptional regulator [Amycolatopsis sp. Poz14]|uniref:LuxR C-terminal-related transcriptional regulator n=1 Tax=Amycolatopsis sp. Poz14 TaxID=1447705 RepID=UPI001EE86E80|nr:LuxR C-terminal-related transcriptional regulator [Amycolatopsis sp. Poz14]MCG3753929.1 LuxR family transcriptional regulator [Amycolatopsis sp. Poz14]